MKRWSILITLLAAGCLPGFTQRFFSFQVDSLSRSYLLVDPPNEITTGLPMIILLHDQKVMPFALARMEWSSLKNKSIMVFPAALRNQWSCRSNIDSLKADEKFLLRIIFEVRNNFRTDPSRVFIIGIGSAFCLADDFAKKHPSLIRAAVPWNYSSRGSSLQQRASSFDSLISHHPGVAIPKSDTVKFAFDQNEKEEKLAYASHTTLAFHLGRWQQAKSTHTDFDTQTMTDLSKYHFQFGLEVGYHFTERWSAFVNSDFMIIPKERTVNSISWGGGQGVNVNASGKGGIVIPYGMGVRYTIPRGNFRPFFAALLGATFLFIGGGTASGGAGGMNTDIVKRKVSVFRYSPGTGFDLRISRTVSLQCTGQYAFSLKIAPQLASINRFQGLSLMTGLLFILSKK